MFRPYALLAVAITVLAVQALPAQERTPLSGVVRDATTREPVPGATVRLVTGARGTFTSRTGTFRLPLERGSHELRVSSIGYEPRTVTVTAGGPPIEVLLTPSSVALGGISVSADLTAEEVVRNAIARKAQNLERLRSFSGLLYSRFGVDIEGNAFGMLDDADRGVILETFSRYWFERVRRPDTRIEVIQRRQTANIPADANLFALGNFVSFYDSELPLLNANLMTPLAADAFSRYRFEIADRTVLNGQLVYVLKVIPTTRVLPAFEGTMKIVKGTFNLVEIDVRPTEATAIAFVRDLRFVQRFERLTDSVWFPTNLEVTGAARVEVIKGIASVDIGFRATSIFTEAAANVPVPDSVFATGQMFTAAPDADSSRSEFWESNSLSELSEEEKATYARIDSLVAEKDTAARKLERGFSLEALPHLGFNRVSGLELGARLDFEFGPIEAGYSIGYALSLRHALHQANLALSVLRTPATLTLKGGYFADLGSGYFDSSIPRIVNSVAAVLFHRDYYDWYSRRGWRAGFEIGVEGLTLDATYERATHAPELARVARSAFVREPLRPNPAAMAGDFETIGGKLSWGRSESTVSISSTSSSGIGMVATAVRGRRDGGEWFDAIEGRLNAELATIPTGYRPMMLTLALHAGTASAALPPQYQFRQRTGLVVISPLGHFMTAPNGRYGGDRYLAIHAEHNFTDLPWRWLGLPTYEGRGLELIASGAAGQWESFAASGASLSTYTSTMDRWYTELGVGLGRIPTFISNVIYFRVDARIGLGPLAEGNWGMNVTLSSPF